MGNFLKTAATAMAVVAMTACFSACSDDDTAPRVKISGTTVAKPQHGGGATGLWLLNEGNMGSNKASLDYFDYKRGKFYLNVFSAINPKITLGLGDTGNDVQIYNGMVYAVINGSNLLEIIDAESGRHRASVAVDAPRNIAFAGNYAYVSSYSACKPGDAKKYRGSVWKINLATYAVEGKVEAGYQPEGIACADGKVFVANSGGYNYPDYDHTLNVIDPNTLEVEKTLDFGLNLGRVAYDGRDGLYVVSSGNYADVGSKIYKVNTATATLCDSIATAVSSIAVAGDSLYILGVEYKAPTWEAASSFALYNTRTRAMESGGFITDGTDSRIVMPYCVAVNPDNGDIMVADARDFKSPGQLLCYNRAGKLQWTATTGLIPGHIAFAATALGGLE